MTQQSRKYFPISTDTSCRTKWGWSTIYLNDGTTASCCRASSGPIGSDFANFHNTQKKVQSRQLMLEGKWPGDGCESCEVIERAGGFSDRNFQNQIPDIYPKELDSDPTAVVVDPSILEVFFSNTCNLKCVYCNAKDSSAIQAENAKFGGAIIPSTEFEHANNQYQQLAPAFWQWFVGKSTILQRLQVLGGEPFLQKDVTKLIDYFDNNPHPDLEFNIITNLSVGPAIIHSQLSNLSDIVNSQKLKRVDIQVSVESWGIEQEYTRHGFDCDTFESNLQLMFDMGTFRIGLLSTVNALSIMSMPTLCERFLHWNKSQTIYWYMNSVTPADGIFSPLNFDYKVFEQALDSVANALPNTTWDEQMTRNTFLGIQTNLKNNCKDNIIKQQQLCSYLNENDRRRNTDWRRTFPWLINILERNNVV